MGGWGVLHHMKQWEDYKLLQKSPLKWGRCYYFPFCYSDKKQDRLSICNLGAGYLLVSLVLMVNKKKQQKNDEMLLGKGVFFLCFF